MKILKHILCDSIKEENNTFSIENLYDENMVVVDNFPSVITITIGVWIGDFPLEKNQFKMKVKDLAGNIIGIGNYFRSNFVTRNRVGFITTKFHDIHFYDENSRYFVEYWNDDTLVTSIEIGAVKSWLDIYYPVKETGYILTEK